MSEKCRTYAVNSQCEPEVIKEPAEHICAPFEVCLPFGKKLVYNGDCMTIEGTPTVPDGEYGVITVQGGCIISAKPNPVFENTPGPCAPAASPCGGSSGEAGVTLQPGARNLLSYDGAGRLGAFLNVSPGDGITVEGSGTTADPLVISAKSSGEATGGSIVSGDTQAIVIDGSGTASDPFVINLAESGLKAGTYGGFTFDSYGRVIKYQDAGSTYISSLVEGPGIRITSGGQVATIGLTPSGVDAQVYRLGAWDVDVDLSGRLLSVTRMVEVEPNVIDPYYMLLDINQYGTIIGMQSVTRVPDSQFSKVFAANRANTVMSVRSNMQGSYRIVYKGTLGIQIESDSGSGSGSSTTRKTGFMAMPAGVSVQVDDDAYEAYAWYDAGAKAITEIHCLTGVLAPGDHRIVLDGVTSFVGNGVMDVSIVTKG